MNHKLWSSLTVVLLTTALSPVSSYAKSIEQITPNSRETSIAMEPVSGAIGATESENNVVTMLYRHEWQDSPAVTLYVRSIPVLTFISPASTATEEVKVGEIPLTNEREFTQSRARQIPLPLIKQSTSLNIRIQSLDDPVFRARNLAAQLNELSRQGVNAEAIGVHWNSDTEAFDIQVNDETLVTINEQTILPDTTENLAQDALQVTNRLRRLLGNAPPLSEIAGIPNPPVIITVPEPTQVANIGGRVLRQLRGMASWYGPGFHGRRSASGERFNQNALTAAHRTLPFGTRVRVTNVNNGQSVVVRINDRGPFSRGRIIDLSAAAARQIGMMASGVAPVKVEVLGN